MVSTRSPFCVVTDNVGSLGSQSVKKAVVVGAGITGCIAAIHLREQGMDVSIYESAGNVGGILRDLVHDGERYFSSCQYLNSCAKWLADLQRNCSLDLLEFDHTYGSYTSLSDTVVVRHDFAGPVVRQPLQKGLPENGAVENLESRFLRYPHPVGELFLNWLKGYTSDARELHHSCAIGMQVSRIYFEYDDVHLLSIKRRSSLSDELLGIPRSKLDLGASGLRALLPTNGFDEFFARIGEHLTALGIEVFLNAPVTPRFNHDRDILLSVRGQDVAADVVVWCGNPVPLIVNAGCGRLDNPTCRMLSHACDVGGDSAPLTPHYIQVYSTQSPITRIFLYQLGGRNKATVESFDRSGVSASVIAEHANSVLATSGSKVHLTVKHSVKQRRYILYTTEDFRKFGTFERFSFDSDIVGGAWWIYGRNARIERVLNDMASKLERS